MTDHPPTQLDHDNSRSLSAIASDLHSIVKIMEADPTGYDKSNARDGIAESLDQIATQTKAIADTLESLDKHFVEWLDRDARRVT